MSILLLTASSTAPLPAAGAWDFYGGAGLNVGRAGDPGFAGTRQANPAYDPNSTVCSNPADPNYDAICRKTIAIPSSERRSSYTGSARVTGGLKGDWGDTQFDITYSPMASLYFDRAELNQVGHNLASTWRHDYSPRASVNFNALFNYTPEQDVDPANLQQNSLLVNRTSRTYGTFRGSYGFQSGPRTTFDWSYRYALRAFSSDTFVDSSAHSLGLNWRRRLGPRGFVQSGYEYGLTLYGDGPSVDPNTGISPRFTDAKHHRASAGWGLQSARGFTLNINAGYNIVVPVRTELESFSGLYTDTSLGWSGTRFSTVGGYVRALTDGGGAFSNAQSEVIHATARAAFTKSFSGDLAVSRNAHTRLAQGTAGGEETVRSLNGRASLNYSFARDWAVNVGWTHYRQGGGSAGGTAPDVRASRYSAGISWSVR
jgi:hypothetical protein